MNPDASMNPDPWELKPEVHMIACTQGVAPYTGNTIWMFRIRHPKGFFWGTAGARG